MARELNNMYGKHRPFMCNKNVKKTFEILRSEITFLMDLYMQMVSSKVHPACHNIANGIKPGSNSKKTDKHAAVRYIPLKFLIAAYPV